MERTARMSRLNSRWRASDRSVGWVVFDGIGPPIPVRRCTVDRVTHLLLGAGHGHHDLDLDPERPGGELPGTVDLIPLPGW